MSARGGERGGRSPAEGRFPLGVPLFRRLPGGAPDPLTPVVERLRMVLETRRGTVPWRPELGLALDDLLGEPLTAVQLTLVRHRLTAALRAALPDARVVNLAITVRTRLGSTGAQPRNLPIAERALVPFGSEASLVAELTLETAAGVHAFSVDLSGEPPP